MNEYLKYLDTDEIRWIMDVYKTLPVKGTPFVRDEPKKSRNELCSCGSGKKYKKCCIHK